MYSYEDKFFDFVDKSSSKSALALIPKLVTVLQVDSILDVGCGRGIWLAAWKQLMNCSVTGIDGNYVDNGSLHILRTEFFAKDLSQSFDLGRTFDLVQCLEVAEHLPESSADSLADNLVKHGDLILFSAARPGQGGEHHVNERPLTYWISKFRDRGFDAYDIVRPIVRGISEIEPWYRFNTLVFANKNGKSRILIDAKALCEEGHDDLDTLVPFWWRLRCRIIGLIPAPIIHVSARLKHRLYS